MKKEKAAKLIRILTIPPIMITLLLLILGFNKRELFGDVSDIVVMVVLLGIFPVLAYPLQKVIPKLNDEGRNGQRKLAFIMTMIGYTAAFIWAIVSRASTGIMLICSTYFLSVAILSACNLLHFKASGHSCSLTGPFVFLLYFLGKAVVIPLTIVASAVIWSSVTLKRHTVPQLIGGIAACVIAFGISIGVIMM
ncbi:MAG: hypothetical protein K6C13_13550 [Oscillospiraceae bacterium]|nr:hypothetical protein [Oscillospiraceae bacterium]